MVVKVPRGVHEPMEEAVHVRTLRRTVVFNRVHVEEFVHRAAMTTEPRSVTYQSKHPSQLASVSMLASGEPRQR